MDTGSKPIAHKPLTLSRLSDLTIVARTDLFPLTSPQEASLEKLALLWRKISDQTGTTLARHEQRNADPTPPSSLSLDTPFVAPWDVIANLTKRGSPIEVNNDAECRALFHGLHEVAVLATLLASYGTPTFLGRAAQKLSLLATASSPPPAFVRRVYTHPLIVQAINIALETIERSPLELPNLGSTNHLNRSFLGLHKICATMAEAHTKEARLVSAISETLTTPEDANVSPLIIGTAPSHAHLLASRLRHRLQPAPAEVITEITTALIQGTDPALLRGKHVFISPVLDLPYLATTTPVRILIYSPIYCDGTIMNFLSDRTIRDIKSLFPNSDLTVLRTSSHQFSSELLSYEELSGNAPEPHVTSDAQLTVPSASPLSQRRIPNKTVKITIPRPEQKLLIDQEMLDSLTTDTQPQQTSTPLEPLDRTTLPDNVQALNERLGTSIIRSNLVPRIDQVEQLFQMLHSSSFEWMIKAPTGFGKTPLAAMVQAVPLGNSPLTPQGCQRGFRTAYLVPNVDLCQQAKNEFLRFLAVTEDEISILHGKIPLKIRREIIESGDNRIVVATPETFRKVVASASPGRGFDSFSLVIIDEFQCAEGNHAMAQVIKQAREAGLQVLVMSGTPARDDDDLAEKRELLPLRGTLVPQTLKPLKNHELLTARTAPEIKTLSRELSDLTFAPFLEARERLINGERLYGQGVGSESESLFETRRGLSRAPHIVSFSAPTAERVQELKNKISNLKEQVTRALADRKPLGLSGVERLEEARSEFGLASLALARVGSLGASLNPLMSSGRSTFLFEFAETWMSRYLESHLRIGNFPLFQDYMRTPEYRGIVRHLAQGTPFRHLLDASTVPDALTRAFNLEQSLVPVSPKAREDLFLGLAMNEMAQASSVENEKENNLFERIEELHHRGQARGILIFAEPKHFTRYLALRLHYRFRKHGIRAAFVTGDGDGFADHLAEHYTSLKTSPIEQVPSPIVPFERVRSAFQSSTREAEERVDIIVATSKLAVGHNLSAASEVHIYTMHADAQKLLQEIGRVGRPDGSNFFDRVGQCFYHVNTDTPEWYLFRSAIKKYAWIRDTLTQSERWSEGHTQQLSEAPLAPPPPITYDFEGDLDIP